jgi:uncharacterized LabA/DUF88 family protein
MERIFIAIDGSNFYHRMREGPINLANLLEFNYDKFAYWLAKGNEIVAKNYYIGVIRAKTNQLKAQQMRRDQQRLFAKLQKTGWKISAGYILDFDGKYHEKGVDVQIAIDLLRGAYENIYDKFILLSSDTDLLPAIKLAISLGKKIEYVGFSHKPSFALIRHASLTKLLTKEDLLPFILKK